MLWEGAPTPKLLCRKCPNLNLRIDPTRCARGLLTLAFARPANYEVKCTLGATKQRKFANLVFYRSQWISQGAAITSKTLFRHAIQYVFCESKCKLPFLPETCRRTENLDICSSGCQSSVTTEPLSPTDPNRFAMCFANRTANPASQKNIGKVWNSTVLTSQSGSPRAPPEKNRKRPGLHFCKRSRLLCAPSSSTSSRLEKRPCRGLSDPVFYRSDWPPDSRKPFMLYFVKANEGQGQKRSHRACRIEGQLQPPPFQT